ncbi:MAG TPA: glycosyltransferase [Longimicrobiales bacterium]|nr:glycosyltransferase [Longimicrobiales bacterium]
MKEGKRLTFFGSSLVSAYWNGAATYYRGLLRALHGRGYQVTFCEPDAYDRQAHRDLATDPPYAKVIVYRSAEERDRLVADAFRGSDWVIKCSGVGIWDRELEVAVSRGAGQTDRGPVRTAFWDVDAPATLARMDADPADPFHAALPLFDHVFTYGGGPPVVERYEAAGARICTPVYNGLDPAEHRPEPGVERRWDLLFMGNRLPDREERVHRFFLDVARSCPEYRFALGGEGWGDLALPENLEYLGHVPTADHNRVNAAARLVLNIHRASMVENGFSPATRMFEAAGAGACQVTDAWEGIPSFFEPEREILVAEDGEAVARYVREVDEERAREIGAAARARALAEHTYERRAAEVEEVLARYGTVAA